MRNLQPALKTSAENLSGPALLLIIIYLSTFIASFIEGLDDGSFVNGLCGI